MTRDTSAFEDSITKFKRMHNPLVDSWVYNGGTLLALAASIAAATTWPEGLSWAPRVLAGIAAFVIGAERSLNFGARWQYHLACRSTADALLMRLRAAQHIGDDKEYTEELRQISSDFTALVKNSKIPAGKGPQG